MACKIQNPTWEIRLHSQTFLKLFFKSNSTSMHSMLVICTFRCSLYRILRQEYVYIYICSKVSHQNKFHMRETQNYVKSSSLLCHILSYYIHFMAHKEHYSERPSYKYIATWPTRLYMSTIWICKGCSINLPILYSHQ